MINNFNTFPFEFIPGEFYFFQIINRQKNWTNNKSRCIKSYFVRDQEHLDKKMPEMIKIADTTNSRIYMHPSRRSERKISLELLTYTADCIKYNEIGRLWRWYETVCGRDHWVEKIRLVDVDTKDQWIVEEVIQHIKLLRPYREPWIINETVNGYHILYRGWFDSSQYKLWWDIHKNNPTLLYYDDAINKEITWSQQDDVALS